MDLWRQGAGGACDGQGGGLDNTKVALKRWDTSSATDLRPALAVMTDSHSGIKVLSVLKRKPKTLEWSRDFRRVLVLLCEHESQPLYSLAQTPTSDWQPYVSMKACGAGRF